MKKIEAVIQSFKLDVREILVKANLPRINIFKIKVQAASKPDSIEVKI